MEIVKRHVTCTADKCDTANQPNLKRGLLSRINLCHNICSWNVNQNHVAATRNKGKKYYSQLESRGE